MQSYDIKDTKLAPTGHQKIEWVKAHMPLLNYLEEDFRQNQPFKGMRIALSIHLEAKTAYLCKVLTAGGADMYVTGSNPLSTQDDVAAALVEDGLNVYAHYDASDEQYFGDLHQSLNEGQPHIIIDDGGDLVNILHTERRDLLPNILGGNEETTTGVIRLRAREKEGVLEFPMIDVNEAYCKHLFDNRYGTGQSVWNGINGTTNLIVAGKYVVVAGYGWCGKGVAMRAKGLGAKVIVTEIDPIKAMEAKMDGFEVMNMLAAAPIGDIFVTVTGCSKVIRKEHYEVMKEGAILSNAGHFDVEVWKPDLEAMAVEIKEKRKNIMGYKMADGRWIYLLAGGRLVNLAAGDGHPAEIMDMSFAIQALSAKYIVEKGKNLGNKVHNVPAEIDRFVAYLKLKTMGIEIEQLTAEQEKYLSRWGEE